jgi:O-antigen/teichoic acid export membrane protein
MNAATCTMPLGTELTAAPKRKLVALVTRYGLSASGPVCISFAHFVAAIICLRTLPHAAFGLFSFALVVAPFCLSLSGALIGAPAAIALRRGTLFDSDLGIYLKSNLAFTALTVICVLLLMRLSSAGWFLAALFAGYTGTMSLRWFARTLFYARGQASRVLASDLCYSLTLLAGLFLLHDLQLLTAATATELLLGAAALALLSFGIDHLVQQFDLTNLLIVRSYRSVWFDLARWSALGVILTELTVNAHAYLVTFLCGPAAFAPIAAGALFIRPVQLVLAAIPDRERPIMARQIGSGDHAGARHSVRQFRMAAGTVWIATVMISATLLIWFPHVVLRTGYDPSQALLVLVFFSAITAARTFRTPESVLLQAAGEFRSLASASLAASLVSLGVTLVLLLVAGPIFSLAGVLAGEFVVTARVLILSRNWMRAACPA